jgi:hypothetical protein
MHAKNAKNFYSRLGLRSDVDRQIAEAKKIGAVIVEDKEAGTIEVTYGTDQLFKAICKNGRVWIVMYNAKYYPR